MAKKVKAIVEIADPRRQGQPCPTGRYGPGPRTVSTSWVSARSIMGATQSQMGQIVPVEITIFQDQSFTFYYQDTASGRPD